MAETRFELLAPAKDLACGLAALECGAALIDHKAFVPGGRRAQFYFSKGDPGVV